MGSAGLAAAGVEAGTVLATYKCRIFNSPVLHHIYTS